MQDTTRLIVRTAIESDQTLAPAERSALISMLCAGAKPNQTRAVKIDEAARRLNRSKRAIHLMINEGVLTAIRARGRVRALGITEESLNALLSGEVK